MYLMIVVACLAGLVGLLYIMWEAATRCVQSIRTSLANIDSQAPFRLIEDMDRLVVALLDGMGLWWVSIPYKATGGLVFLMELSIAFVAALLAHTFFNVRSIWHLFVLMPTFLLSLFPRGFNKTSVSLLMLYLAGPPNLAVFLCCIFICAACSFPMLIWSGIKQMWHWSGFAEIFGGGRRVGYGNSVSSGERRIGTMRIPLPTDNSMNGQGVAPRSPVIIRQDTGPQNAPMIRQDTVLQNAPMIRLVTVPQNTDMARQDTDAQSPEITVQDEAMPATVPQSPTARQAHLTDNEQLARELQAFFQRQARRDNEDSNPERRRKGE